MSIELIVYRILGNDLAPRHGSQQTLENIDFVLKNEVMPADVDRRWLLNRITDETAAAEIKAMLDQAGEPYVEIPFETEGYAQCLLDPAGLPPFFDAMALSRVVKMPREQAFAIEWLYLQKSLYAININKARNTAIRLGRKEARWVLPLDGNTFFHQHGINRLMELIRTDREEKYLIIGFTRIFNNDEVLYPDYLPDRFDEPQIAFRDDAQDLFDENLRYGNMNKAELLGRLGVRGPWDKWPYTPWEPRHRFQAKDKNAYILRGWVARLASKANPAVEQDQNDRWTARFDGVVDYCNALDRRLVSGDRLKSALNCYANGFAAARPYREKVLSVAEQLIDQEHMAVAQTPDRPPFVGSRDYYSPAPHYRTAPDGRVVRRDGERDPVTSDRTRLQDLAHRTVTMLAAYEATGQDRFLHSAADGVRLWFLDPERGMTPHCRYAQLRPDRPELENFTGIVEFRHFWPLLDAIRCLVRAGGLSETEHAALVDWFQQFSHQLAASPAMQQAASATNNIANCHDLVVSSIAAFTGDVATFSHVMQRVPIRIFQQIEPFGAQLQELSRTRPLHYSLFNIALLMNLSSLARAHGIDLWGLAGKNHRNLCWALRFAFQNRMHLRDYPKAAQAFDQRLGVLIGSVPPDAVDRPVLDSLNVPAPQQFVLDLDSGGVPWQILAWDRAGADARSKSEREAAG